MAFGKKGANRRETTQSTQQTQNQTTSQNFNAYFINFINLEDESRAREEDDASQCMSSNQQMSSGKPFWMNL